MYPPYPEHSPCSEIIFSVVKVLVDLKFLNFHHISLNKMGEKKKKIIGKKALKARKIVSGNKLPLYFFQFCYWAVT